MNQYNSSLPNKSTNIIPAVISGIIGFGGGFLLHKILIARQRPKALRYMFVDQAGKSFSLTEEQILDIIQHYKNDTLLSEIAKKHNLSIVQLSRVIAYIMNNNKESNLFV